MVRPPTCETRELTPASIKAVMKSHASRPVAFSLQISSPARKSKSQWTSVDVKLSFIENKYNAQNRFHRPSACWRTERAVIA